MSGTGFVSRATDPATGVARITLAGSDPLNVMPHVARRELAAAIEEVGRDESARVLVIDSASERAFSAGVDINELAGLTSWEASRLHEPMSAPERIPQPVIAAIDGHCYGGPFEMALACDFRIVTSRAQLGLPEIKLGQMPGSGGGQRLLRLVGPTRAKLMCMTGQRVDGRTAEAWGIATRCVEPDQLREEVDRLARELSGLAPRALEMVKRSLNAGLDAPLRTALEMEGKMYSTLKGTADYQEGIASWREKRPPSFRGA
jgi:2-oxoglutaroyl-CoA hydrolase